MSPRVAAAAAAALAAAVLAAAPAPARAEPSDRALVLTGLALAPPTYLLGVTLHEGSHAIAAKLAGGTVVDMRLFPPGRDPTTKQFRFGWVRARGLRTTAHRQLFYLAPKLTNLALLGGFAGLVLTDAWPSNRYGQLALTVVATGMWVDFSKDLLAFRSSNDVVKALDLWCLTGWRQVPARLVYAGAVVGLGALVARGYQRTFDRGADAGALAARILPLVQGRF